MRLDVDAAEGEMMERLPDVVEALLRADPTTPEPLVKAAKAALAGIGETHGEPHPWPVAKHLEDAARLIITKRYKRIGDRLGDLVAPMEKGLEPGELRKARRWLDAARLAAMRKVVHDEHMALALELYGPSVLSREVLERLRAEGVLTELDVLEARMLGLLGIAPELGALLADNEKEAAILTASEARDVSERLAREVRAPAPEPRPGAEPRPEPKIEPRPGLGVVPHPPSAAPPTGEAPSPVLPRIEPTPAPSEMPPPPPAEVPPAPPGEPPPAAAEPPPPEPLKPSTPSQWAAQAARQRGGQQIVGLGNRVAADMTTIAIDSEGERAQELRHAVAEAVATGIEEGERGQDIKNRVVRALNEDYSRDIDRIVATEVHAGISQGQRDRLLDRHGGGAMVTVVPAPGACRECMRVYTRGGTPKTFLARWLPPSSVNFRVKAADRQPCVPPLHPWCRCALKWVPKDWVVRPNGQVVPPSMAKSSPFKWGRHFDGSANNASSAAYMRRDKVNG